MASRSLFSLFTKDVATEREREEERGKERESDRGREEGTGEGKKEISGG